jgi:hypothetical protein
LTISSSIRGWRRHGAALRLVRQIASEGADPQIARVIVKATEHAMEFYLAAGFRADGPARTLGGGGVRMYLGVHLVLRATTAEQLPRYVDDGKTALVLHLRLGPAGR